MKDKLSKKEIISYGLPHIGMQAAGMFMTTFLLIYYTDIVGLSTISITIMFLVVRLFDAINDPIIGVWMDRSKETDYGKFRKFALIAGVLGAFATIGVYLVPEITYTGKLVYSYITYGVSGIFGTVMGIAYFGLPSRMTRNQLDRTKLGQFKSIGGAIGGIVAMVAAIPLIKLIGRGNDRIGYAGAIAVISIVSIVTLFIGIKGVPEGKVVSKSKKEEKMVFSKIFKVVLTNIPFLVLMVCTFLSLLSGNVRSAFQVYFFKYNVGNEMLVSLMAAVAPSIMIIGSFFVHLFTKKFGKKGTVIIGKAVTILSLLILLFFNYMSSVVLIISAAVSGVGLALNNITTFSMLADTIEFGQWRTGLRTEGTLYSINGFAVKVGMAAAGIVGGIILTMIGYEEMAVQPEATLNGIEFGFIMFPIILECISLLLMLLYPLTEKKYQEIITELDDAIESQEAVGEY